MRSWTFAIFVAVFSFYMLTSSREPAWGDAHPMWEVAERMVEHGAIDIHTRWPEDIPVGRDGKIYGIASIGAALAHVPGVAIAGIAHQLAPDDDILFRPLAVHVGPSALGALAAVLFFWLLGDLGIRRKTASVCTAILVLATTTWVYAHYPYSEILQLACFLGLFRAVIRVTATPSTVGPEAQSAAPPNGGAGGSKREALWLGAWAGMMLNAKYVFAIAIVGAAIAVIWTYRKQRPELKRVIGWAAVAGAPFVILALAYNYARWGSPLQTGYGPYLDAYFGGSVFDAAWGTLLSPNKSSFLYSPPLVLAALGMPAAIRANPRLGVALVALVVPPFVVACTYRSWSGDYAWGPRLFVYAVPPLLVGLAWFVDNMSRWRKVIVGAIVAAGIAVQLLGVSLYWDHFIRVAIDTKNQWLGNPNRSGAYIADKGRGHCDSCFEDTYEIMWTPAFQPIRGHWWLVTSIARGDTAAQAQQDAPWRTYTSLNVNLEASYPRARIDWWGLLWIKDATRTWIAGLVMLLVLVGGTAFGVVRWLQLHRATADP